MSDDERPATPDQPQRRTAVPAIPAVQQRADALSVAVRRALWPTFAVILVIGAWAVIHLVATEPDEISAPGPFVVYSLMTLAILPVLVTMGASGATALLSKEPLPARDLSILAGIVTAVWVAWVATGWLGLLLGVTTTTAALVLSLRRSLLLRLPVAVVVAALGAVVSLWVSPAVA